MIFEKFVEQVLAYWKKYLKGISQKAESGLLKFPPGYDVCYPNMILFTKCEGYYVCELIGVSEIYSGLTIKRQKEISIYRYMSQLYDDEPEPLLAVDRGARLRGLTLSSGPDLEKVSARFPSAELNKSFVNRTNGRGSVVAFSENHEYCVFESCVFVNVREELYRCKNVLNLMVFKSSVSAGYLERFFSEYMQEAEVHGVHCIPDEYVRRQLVAGQLQSLYFFRGLHETTLGEFFRLHPDVIYRAFKTDKFIYEPYLEWVEHDGTCSDTAINPDLMIRREDGLYDIYDLKTALLDKKNLTKGGRKRRRFIDYVEEGVAQLANYREYFSYPLNAEFAKDKYGMEVVKPGLVLVVGNWDNSERAEVLQACRRYPDVRIIDYDTLCHLFLGNLPGVQERQERF